MKASSYILSAGQLNHSSSSGGAGVEKRLCRPDDLLCFTLFFDFLPICICCGMIHSQDELLFTARLVVNKRRIITSACAGLCGGLIAGEKDQGGEDDLARHCL